jgi:hypothetical protein
MAQHGPAAQPGKDNWEISDQDSVSAARHEA